MGALRVPKLEGLSKEEMTMRFVQSQPVVLKDAQDGWAAREKWSFEWIAREHGAEEVICSDRAPFFLRQDRNVIRSVMAPLREVVRYIRGDPNALRPLQRDAEHVFYANSWGPFLKNADMLADVSDRLYCISDLIPRSNLELNQSLTKVFLGPAGTISRLHHDTYATHVWLSQIRAASSSSFSPQRTPGTCHMK